MRIFLRNIILVAVAALTLAGCVAPEPPITAPTGMVYIKGGKFEMGTDTGMPFEGPVHSVEISPFFIDEHEVTVADFEKFVTATGYQTEAEKFGWSGIFDFQTGQWTRGDGANWRFPEGNTFAAKPNEPVVQISWNDANQYAKWAGKRLPTEAEFEYAARGGLIQKEYAWGDDLKPGGKLLANWWQGTFPTNNLIEDGFLSRAPVKSFPANGYGVYDLTGNVWEWCSDNFADDYYAKSEKRDPKGPPTGEERVIRGGSFLCAENFCSNYRVAGRSRSAPDSGLSNLGFRCVRDVKVQ